MLYFRTKPDQIFLVILRQAFASELQEITRISRDRDFGAWEAGFGIVSEHFTPYSALTTLEQLLIASDEGIVYRLSDYHWLLVYECLKNYSALYRDLAWQKDDGLPITEYPIEYIDFHGLTNLYFWDTEFLFLSHQDSHQIPCLDSSDSSVIMDGIHPHPRHLQLIPVEDPSWAVPEPHELFGKHSRQYPDCY